MFLRFLTFCYLWSIPWYFWLIILSNLVKRHWLSFKKALRSQRNEIIVTELNLYAPCWHLYTPEGFAIRKKKCVDVWLKPQGCLFSVGHFTSGLSQHLIEIQGYIIYIYVSGCVCLIEAVLRSNMLFSFPTFPVTFTLFKRLAKNVQQFHADYCTLKGKRWNVCLIPCVKPDWKVLLKEHYDRLKWTNYFWTLLDRFSWYFALLPWEHCFLIILSFLIISSCSL